MLLLTSLFFAAPVPPQLSLSDEKPTAAALEAALWYLLDSNADGSVDRYEAAAAAMAWVDEVRFTAGREAGASDGDPAEAVPANLLLGYLENSAAEFQMEADFYVETLDKNGDARLDKTELPPTLTDLDAFGDPALLSPEGWNAADLVNASAMGDPAIHAVWEALSQIAYSDKDGDGFVTAAELGDNPRIGAWSFADVDADGDGKISAIEAAYAVEPSFDESNLEAEAEAWFKDLDANGDAALGKKELDEDFELDCWRVFDTSGDRRLELVEFLPLAAASELPATFTVEGKVATMSGTITGSTPGRFLRVLLEHRDVNELVLAFVPGSMNDEANGALLDLAHQSGVTIRVPRGGSTASGGADLLLAGKRRIVEQGAMVGIHSWSGEGVEGRDLPKDHESHAFYVNRFAALGIDPAFYWRTLEAAPADGMHYMTEDEIHQFGVRTESQGLEVFQTGTRSSLRGLCGVTNEIAWATGSGATVLRTTDAGRSWKNLAPASIAGLDVRDVFAISADVCWIMTAGPGESSRILFTENGGGTWVEQYRETSPQAFLDGLDAWDAGTLIAYGDPMEDGRFRVLLTEDGGQTWTPSTTGPLALESGEASFAASGTGVRTLGGLRAWIVTGGTKDKARVFWSEDTGQTWEPVTTPVAAKGAGAGAFSVSFRDDGTGVIVGGDFLAREVGGTANAAWSDDFGKTWQASVEGPRGQRAGSVALGNGWFLATGQTGTDVSRDGGKTWRAFSSEGFHCVDAALEDGTIWLAGPNGRVGRVR